MRIFILFLVLSGCTSTEKDRTIICKVECIDCAKVIHECSGNREELLIEVNN